jgi:hypothetical protein
MLGERWEVSDKALEFGEVEMVRDLEVHGREV